ncbi:MAG: DEAD/DEAH box helicase, ATP-dependent RNA helicase RhlE [Candidatus Peregrinibacteria bacterium GW2011_GWF2_39_17]|nr:MAG: DEAD/DEAH box helicase, ATP-dependent RNA helicase RhlE [Candidatus Peregrinibacteria bacterium GW2011_GWF2_39_17]HCW32709.1 ATP-dependent helicase [Candidatus Peregrinibacteria bacterium]
MNQNPQPNTSPINPQSGPSFFNLGIAPKLMEVITRLNYKIPTSIQRQSIPVGLQGKDLVGVAQTGTGKTLAFGIPLIQRLIQIPGSSGLIVLPTRELALQVDEALRQIGSSLGLKTVVIIGGAPIRQQIQKLSYNPHIIIATPGRLNDHLQQRTANLKNVKIVVLDEADRMLDMGFAPQIKQIFQYLPQERQTMLFSATLGPEIMKMATSFLKIPIRIEVAPTGSVADHLTQEIFIISKPDKSRLVDKLLQQYLGSTLIFTRTKYGARKLTREIKNMGHSAVEIHSDCSTFQRKDAIAGFKSGKYRILIATDIASRGIDVNNIELVINYDLPTNTEDYVHRIGRTARAGGSGHAISLATPDQRRELRNIERLIRKNLPISPVPQLPPQRPSPTMPDHHDQKSFSKSHSAQNNSRFRRRPPSRDRKYGSNHHRD